MKVLVVEDEQSIREVVSAYLKQAGFNVVEASDGEEALACFKANDIDLIILDINLPKINGLDVCKIVRESSSVPIIMVTARVEEIDELIGLEYGADDYVKKPFSPTVLVARVKALLRRHGDEVVEYNGLSIDPEKMQVKKNELTVNLTTTQFNILYILARSPGKVFSRDEILDRAYNDSIPPDVLDRTIDAHIKSIRKQIEDDTKNPKYILTVIGKGYKFNDEIKK